MNGPYTFYSLSGKISNDVGIGGEYVSDHEYRITLPDSDAFEKAYLGVGAIDGLMPGDVTVTEDGSTAMYYTKEGVTVSLKADYGKDDYTVSLSDGGKGGTDDKKDND